MKSKESLFVKYMKYFYQISGPLDEYRKHEMERIGNNAFFFLYIGELLTTIIVLFISQVMGIRVSFYILLGVNIWLMPLSILSYISWASKKAGISNNEIEVSNVKQAKKRIIFRSIFSSIGWGLFMWFALALFDTWQDPQVSFLANLEMTIGFIMVFVIIMIIATIFDKFRKIKTFKDD